MLVVATVMGSVQAATLSGAGTHETLLEQDSLDFLTIGVDYQHQQRDISTSSQGKMRLKSQTIDGYVGFDAFQWLILFVTAGGSAAKVSETGSFNEPKFKWSTGFNLNLWHIDLAEPEFMEGRLSLRTHTEFAMHASGDESEKIKWSEMFAALLVNYEVLAVRAGEPDTYPYSLDLYVGPAVSWLFNGYYNAPASSGGQRVDFNQDRVFGLVGGVELYVASNLSFGGAIQYYDAVSLSASARYHF